MKMGYLTCMFPSNYKKLSKVKVGKSISQNTLAASFCDYKARKVAGTDFGHWKS